MRKGTLFVISAPSGAGKSTLISRIRPMFPDILYSISCTTRPPRENEIHRVDYFFVTKSEFFRMIHNNEFLEWKEVHGNLYGTPIAYVTDALSAGKCLILDIDVQGAVEVFRKIPEAEGIFITVPSLEILEKRIRSRGSDPEDSIRTRMHNAPGEMAQAGLFHRIIVNDDLDTAVQQLARVIRTQSAIP